MRESVRLDDHMASNSSFLLFFKLSIISPVRELWDSKTLTIFLLSKALFKFETLTSGEKYSLNLDLKL